MRRVVRVASAAALVAVLSCQDQVFEPVKNGLVASADLEGDVRVTTKADLLFVIDDSASMAGEQDKLAQGFPALLQKLDQLDPPVDYRLAVLTTSVDERFGPCDPTDPQAPDICSAEFGGTGFACEAGACVKRFPDRAGHLFAAPGNPAVLDSADYSPPELATLFAQNVHVGLEGSSQEQPLRAFETALDSGGLAGFLRDDARLVLFIASDEDDCSDSTGKFLAYTDQNGTFTDQCAEASARGTGQLDSVSAFEQRLRSLEAGGKAREVAAGAVVGLDPATQQPATCTDPACAQRCQGAATAAACQQQCQGALRPTLCESDCVDQCVAFCGSHVPGRRIARLVRDLGGPVSSICEPDFGPALARLARVIGIPTSLDLPSVPGDDRAFFFTVTRAGRTLDCAMGRDFTLDRTSDPPEMTIEKSGACRLMPGDHWSIRYLAAP